MLSKYSMDTRHWCCQLSTFLRSVSRQQLFAPRHRLNACGRMAFSVAGLTACNSLPNDLRDPTRTTANFLL